MILSAVSVLVVAQSSSEVPEGLMNNPVYARLNHYLLARTGPICTVIVREERMCKTKTMCVRNVKTYMQGRTYRSSDCVL